MHISWRPRPQAAHLASSSIQVDERVQSPANNLRLFLRGNFVARPKNGHKNSAKDSTESKSPKRSPLKRPIEQYDHKSKTRVNNPPVGLVTHQPDPPLPSRKPHQYAPHINPP